LFQPHEVGENQTTEPRIDAPIFSPLQIHLSHVSTSCIVALHPISLHPTTRISYISLHLYPKPPNMRDHARPAPARWNAPLISPHLTSRLAPKKLVRTTFQLSFAARSPPLRKQVRTERWYTSAANRKVAAPRSERRDRCCFSRWGRGDPSAPQLPTLLRDKTRVNGQTDPDMQTASRLPSWPGIYTVQPLCHVTRPSLQPYIASRYVPR
jgi:hypothetical protein